MGICLSRRKETSRFLVGEMTSRMAKAASIFRRSIFCRGVTRSGRSRTLRGVTDMRSCRRSITTAKWDETVSEWLTCVVESGKSCWIISIQREATKNCTWWKTIHVLSVGEETISTFPAMLAVPFASDSPARATQILAMVSESALVFRVLLRKRQANRQGGLLPRRSQAGDTPCHSGLPCPGFPGSELILAPSNRTATWP